MLAEQPLNRVFSKHPKAGTLVAADSSPTTAAPVTFARRHIGPTPAQIDSMLQSLGLASLDDLVARCVPHSIHSAAPLGLPEALSESEQLARLAGMADENALFRSFIGTG